MNSPAQTDPESEKTTPLAACVEKGYLDRVRVSSVCVCVCVRECVRVCV